VFDSCAEDGVGLDFSERAPLQYKKLARGFTMVELIVVMILIGILGAVGAARFFNRGTFDAVRFADQARAALHFAQEEAIAQNRSVYTVFDGSGVRLCFSAACGSGNQVQAPFGISTDSVCTSSTWYCVRRPDGVTASLSGTIGFDSLGRPMDASGNLLPSPVVVTMSGGTTSSTVTIEPETGYVH
jgi:MSHA pilin protein MshC